MAKLAGKNKKWGRCHVPGHGQCSVVAEIRHPVARRTERLAHLQRELETSVEQCTCCGKMSRTIQKRRRNTAYYHDALNYTEVCISCFIEEEIYWAEQWAEYYGGLL
jgi:hypothetical protein